MKQHPAIIVIGYDRPRSIERLLGYLRQARFPDQNVQLVISLDFSDSPDGLETKNISEQFEWPHGPKRLILHEKSLGLREHVFRCGDLTREYESIIVLEDDLSVSLEFYEYAVAALEFCVGDDSIGGVALYSRSTNQIAKLPFVPVHDGADNYYLQVAASWGQMWHVSQWNQFRKWYNELANRPENPHQHIPQSAPIPKGFVQYPKSSWLKYYIWYLAETDRFFLYPRTSFSTNHCDQGVHALVKSNRWQVPLAVRVSDFRFSKVDNSLAVYDSFFEIYPDRLKQFNPLLAGYDFDVDLFGTKHRELLKRPFVLTSRKVIGEAKLTFDLDRKPFEVNFRFANEPKKGPCFSLIEPDKTSDESTIELSKIEIVEYFYNVLPWRKIVKNFPRYYWNRNWARKAKKR